MPTYTPPLRDMQFVMHEVLKVTDELKQMPKHADMDADTINAVLEEGGKFASRGDFPAEHQRRRRRLQARPDHPRSDHAQGLQGGLRKIRRRRLGGAELRPRIRRPGPALCGEPVFYEMLNSANQAWTMYPGLTHGAYAALQTHGTDEQKATYLPKMTSGEWTGTMCLTEPHCGTDLGLMRTKAEPQADGTYKITGNKIFISAGEHDMAEQHHAPGAGPPARCASRHQGHQPVHRAQVPCQQDGSLGERNGIYCGGLEHKMGINGNATCQMVLDGAVGTMVGQPHKGMQGMFVMMNAARLGVGNQSLGLTEVAYQNALAYAKDRIQMRSPVGPKAKDKPADPIIVHPDVRKMLLTAKAYAEGGRALADLLRAAAGQGAQPPRRKGAQGRGEMLALLTPIVKAFLTDNGHIATNACMQVFGGHGFIKEWGMEQFVRDNRINMIYEGTNTIQSLDLLGRKVLGNNGATLKKFGKLIGKLVEEEGVNEKMAEFINPLAYLGDQMTKFTTEIGFKGFQNPDEVGAAAVDYLRVAGHLVFGYFWARMAQVALREIAAGNTDPFYLAKLQTARFYFAKLFPETATLMRTARSGARC